MDQYYRYIQNEKKNNYLDNPQQIIGKKKNINPYSNNLISQIGSNIMSSAKLIKNYQIVNQYDVGRFDNIIEKNIFDFNTPNRQKSPFLPTFNKYPSYDFKIFSMNKPKKKSSTRSITAVTINTSHEII